MTTGDLIGTLILIISVVFIVISAIPIARYIYFKCTYEKRKNKISRMVITTQFEISEMIEKYGREDSTKLRYVLSNFAKIPATYILENQALQKIVQSLLIGLKKLKVACIEFELYDYIPVSDPDQPEIKYMIQLLKPPAKTVVAEKIESHKLSDQQIEESKHRSQKRLDEDTRNVGYQRGELKENEDGSWSIAWGGKYPL
ncbi:MAG: hypothetical protein WC169_03390 [Dehalococcoidia bacterium]|jgi:hypothetical protein